MPEEPKPDDATLHVETDNPLLADDRNYYKVEKWTKDGGKVDRMLYAGTNLAKAKEIFAEVIKYRPRIRLTIMQRTRVCCSSGRRSARPRRGAAYCCRHCPGRRGARQQYAECEPTREAPPAMKV
jgi:hypothetical protein